MFEFKKREGVVLRPDGSNHVVLHVQMFLNLIFIYDYALSILLVGLYSLGKHLLLKQTANWGNDDEWYVCSDNIFPTA